MDFQETFLILFFHPTAWVLALILAVSVVVAVSRVLVSRREKMIVVRDE